MRGYFFEAREVIFWLVGLQVLGSVYGYYFREWEYSRARKRRRV
jgi:hypothetical protein